MSWLYMMMSLMEDFFNSLFWACSAGFITAPSTGSVPNNGPLCGGFYRTCYNANPSHGRLDILGRQP